MNTSKPVPAADAQPEDAEWRDLQYAQMLSMQGVWNNPDDEVFNNLLSDAPVAPLILTIPRHQAPALPEVGCLPTTDLGFLNPPLWRERAQVEHDESLLQPVAYGVLFNEAGHAWCYQRVGGDERMEGRLSCGVGGHVDIQDAQPPLPMPNHASNAGSTAAAVPPFDPMATMRRAWLRELTEELHQDPLHLADLRLHGLIYEGISDIGRVHLGVLFGARWMASHPPQPRAGEALQSLGFVPLDDIVNDPRFELWSRLAAQHLLNPHRPAGAVLTPSA